MAKLGINTGSSPDAGDGDALLVGAIKINSNFNEIYSAIGDGSNITNSIGYASTAGIATYASASRIVVKDSGSTVGTAGTIDFGANLTVSAISAGVVTVTASGGTSSQWVSTAAGIHTLSNVGVGTTNPGEKLQVDGNIRVGISTTSNYISFYGTYKDGPLNVGGELPYQHTYIGERIYDYSGSEAERSELLLFKGNDTAGVAGPDRIRLFAGEHRLDVLGFNTTGTFEQVGVSTAAVNAVTVNATGVGIGTTNPTSALTVTGSGTSTSQLYVTGVSTFAGITTVTGLTLFTKQLNVSGIATFNNVLYAPDGINIGDTNVVGASRNIEFSNAFTKRVIFRTNQNADFFSFSDYYGGSDHYVFEISRNGDLKNSGNLSIAGISTFAGITTVTGPTLFTKQLNVSGVSTFNSIKVPEASSPFTFSTNNKLVFGDDLNILSTNTTNYILTDEKILSIGVETEETSFASVFGLINVFPANDLVFGNNSYVTLGFGTEGNNTKLTTIGAGVTITGQISASAGVLAGLSTFTTIRVANDAGNNTAQYITVIGQNSVTGFNTGGGYPENKYFQFSSGNPNFILENVGIGTTNATSKLTVRGGDISVGVSTAHGVILTSPNGTQYRLIVDDSGTLSTVAV